MRRLREPELMDDGALNRELHEEALRGLSRVNRVSFTAQTLWPPILAFSRKAGRVVSVLDLATGGGDVPIALCSLAKRHGADISFSGCDRSDVALQFANRQSVRLGNRVDFFKLDVVSEEIPTHFDVVISSLFLHHLDPAEVILVLSKMSHANLALVSDLIRSVPGLFLTHVATRVLSNSNIVRVDGPRSVHAAYTRDEMKRMAVQAGMSGVEIRRCWPFRMLLCWTRP